MFDQLLCGILEFVLDTTANACATPAAQEALRCLAKHPEITAAGLDHPEINSEL